MIVKKRFVKLQPSIIEEQKKDPLLNDLYICELTELIVNRNTSWKHERPLENNLLIYCTRGNCKITISAEEVEFQPEQFCIVPSGLSFNVQVNKNRPAVFLTCEFNGSKSNILAQDFAVVRNLEPSVNNRIANRKMLFDEIFNNTARGYYNANMHYINFTFSHLLATFVFASRTSQDILLEENPVIQRTILFMEENLHLKLSLQTIADEVGYSVTYLSSTFKKYTNYSPMNYLSHLKITKSCEYLDQTKMRINQIAALLGYQDPYYFSKDFVKKMGMSPRSYRQRIK